MEEDQDEEAFFNEMFDQFPADFDRPKLRGKLARWAWNKVAQAYADGYNQGASDAEEALRKELP